jgi:hypothetical protein
MLGVERSYKPVTAGQVIGDVTAVPITINSPDWVRPGAFEAPEAGSGGDPLDGPGGDVIEVFIESWKAQGRKERRKEPWQS